jgi:AcrR family transcriptional regulator
MKSGGKKEAIEQAAIELFACKGPTGATVKDIAFKAGVTEGALYRHYPGKENMATALFARELAALRLSLIEVLEADMPPAPKLRALVERLYAEYARRPYALMFIILNFQNLQGINLTGETANIYDFIIERTGQLLGGCSPPPDDIVPTLLTGVIMQPVLFHHHGKLAGHPLDYVEQVAAACRRLLGIAEDRP